ncbi:phage shock protein C (PspC) family protein [Rathayibacter oskolensis]|uniref:Phage shock protein C (PspC) family protein n=1 Tax=Rathayibacter oskolensis TaxID=1891671 RepID=A0A1X7PE54_9MICO|nr:ATP-binding protein [Rathayibacter oskolensis]SMH49598.1 phage shock protein C (PspC) family protein [Rathayibacter oskolensis]
MSIPTVTSAAVRPPLRRPRSVVLGGVSAALAEHLGRGARSVRLLFLAATLLGGGGALFYLWLWALVPLADPGDGEPGVRRSVPVAAVLAAGAGVAAVAVLVALGGGDDTDATRALAAVAALSGGAVGWSLGPDRTDPSRSARASATVRLLSCAVLVVAGAAVLAARPSAINAVLAVGVLLVAAGVLAAPRVVRLWTELMGERAARVREEQRAEIAAHLHDSVLQTLALIQNRAGASSEVARIARAQERELRDWLFERDVPVADDLAAEIRATAAAIELDYPVQLEVVAVGAPVPGAASLLGTASLSGATREAMLNAARHAGGAVSVYLESSVDGVDVFVRDRGPGVDLDALPGDRLGIRESIIGRMARAGGSATVGPGAGGTGTEVHLRLPAEVAR